MLCWNIEFSEQLTKTKTNIYTAQDMLTQKHLRVLFGLELKPCFPSFLAAPSFLNSICHMLHLLPSSLANLVQWYLSWCTALIRAFFAPFYTSFINPLWRFPSCSFWPLVPDLKVLLLPLTAPFPYLHSLGSLPPKFCFPYFKVPISYLYS